TRQRVPVRDRSCDTFQVEAELIVGHDGWFLHLQRFGPLRRVVDAPPGEAAVVVAAVDGDADAAASRCDEGCRARAPKWIKDDGRRGGCGGLRAGAGVAGDGGLRSTH